MNRPPYIETPAISALYEHARDIARQVGLELPKQQRGGGSDGNFSAALGVPTLDGLGCPGAGAHASHEHILWRAPGAARGADGGAAGNAWLKGSPGERAGPRLPARRRLGHRRAGSATGTEQPDRAR